MTPCRSPILRRQPSGQMLCRNRAFLMEMCRLTALLIFVNLVTCGSIRDRRDLSTQAPKVIRHRAEDEVLPLCAPYQVCSEVDTYSHPWMLHKCRCGSASSCPATAERNDGHTLGHKTKQLKMCEPIVDLPVCRLFTDVTWTISTGGEWGNETSQRVNCRCPTGSVAYMVKHHVFYDTQLNRDGREEPSVARYKYHFACSPETKLKCRKKEPCQLFSVTKRAHYEEVNTHRLCSCARGQTCPTHHTEASVLIATSSSRSDNEGYLLDPNQETYTGYCTASPSQSPTASAETSEDPAANERENNRLKRRSGDDQEEIPASQQV